LTELVLTAYDEDKYQHEALPALKAAIYRGDLSQAKDVLALYDDTLYDEYDLSQILVEDDYSWVFTEQAADPESMDPEGSLVGLTYPLILLYHHPELLHATIGGSELITILPLTNAPDSDSIFKIQPGFREGLRAMWEIIGYLPPAATCALYDYCRTIGREKTLAKSEGTARLLERIANNLKAVVDRGMGLVVERD
jgi:hypothetical protein